MSQILFIYNGKEIVEKCQKEEKLSEIIQRFIISTQANNVNLVFVYNGKVISDKELSFYEIANYFDKKNNSITMLVYDKENDNKNEFPIIENNIQNENSINIFEKLEKLQEQINRLENKENVLNEKQKNILIEEIEQKLNNNKTKEKEEKNKELEIKINENYRKLEEKINECNNNIIKLENEVNKIKDDLIKIEKNKDSIDKINKSINLINNNNKVFLNDLNILKEKNKDNYITMKIYISEEDIGKDIKLLQQAGSLIGGDLNFNIDDFEIIIDGKSAKKRYDSCYQCKFEQNCKLDYRCQSAYGTLTQFNYFYENFKEEGYYTIKIIFYKKLRLLEKLFLDCKQITEIDLSNFDCSQVNSCCDMFSGCLSLQKINFGSLDFSLSNNFSRMFYNCKSLNRLNVKNFNAKNCSNFYSMFEGCINLKYIDVSNFDTSSCNSIKNMFKNCENITKIDMINWDLSNIKRIRFFLSEISEIGGLFYNCKNLRNIKMNLNFKNEILNDNIITESFSNKKEIKRYIKVIIFSNLPEDGIFTWKKGINNNNYKNLFNQIPKSWIVQEEYN